MNSATSGLLDRLSRLSTTSLADAAPDLRILPPRIRPVVPGGHIAGPVVTARANRDLMSVIAGLGLAGVGDVLVVDAGDQERAVSGELFASEAQRRGLAGLVIDGRCRDSATLTQLALPVWATGVSPRAYPAKAVPEVEVPLRLDDVPVHPGELLIGDDDGLVVGTADELAAALEKAEEIEALEKHLQGEILAGRPLLDAFTVAEHLAALQAGRPSTLRYR